MKPMKILRPCSEKLARLACGSILGFASFAALVVAQGEAAADGGNPIGVDRQRGTERLASIVSGASPRWAEVKLLPSGAGAGDHVGQSLAIDGGRLVVSSDEVFQDRAAYVFERIGGEWAEVAKLTDPSGIPNDFFGSQVALSGSTIAVGAPGFEDFSGAVYLFERDHGGPGQWGLLHRLTMPDPDGEEDVFGGISISGDTLLVGSTGDDTMHNNAGALYVYERDAGGPDNWGWVDKLFASDPGPSDAFGGTSSIDGDTMAVSARQDDDVALNAGAAYVFRRQPDGSWVEIAKLTASDGETDDHFSQSMALSAGTVVVGVKTRDSELGPNHGVVYVFERNQDGPNQWGEVDQLVASDAAPGDNLGFAVAVDGPRIFAGARFTDGLVSDSGAAYLFERDLASPGVWNEVAKLFASDGAELDSFGETVAVSGGFVGVGAPTSDSEGFSSGAVYVFELLPQLSASGLCPGVVEVEVLDATPNGAVVLVGAETGGSSIVPIGPCTDRELDLEDPRVLGVARADHRGGISHSRAVGPGVCGLLLQALDIATCNATETTKLP